MYAALPSLTCEAVSLRPCCQYVIGSHIAHADILDEIGVNLGFLNDLLQQRVYHVVKIGVLETTLLSLGQRRPDSESDDNIIGVLCSAV